MPIESIMLLKKLLKVAAPKLSSLGISQARDWYSRRRARAQAIDGADLARAGSVEHMVGIELKRLASSSGLPAELQGHSFRTWLTADEAVAPFTEALVLHAGGDPQAAARARDALARQYETAMGETQKLAAGPISIVVSDVYGQLTATEATRKEFHAAMTRRIGAQSEVMRHPEIRHFPTEHDLDRLRTMGSALLRAGRASWKMPAFVAPVTLDVHEDTPEGQKSVPLTQQDFMQSAAAGGNFVVHGLGGIGKTTLVLEIASRTAATGSTRTLLFADAALWARSGIGGILDHLAATSAARASGLTSDELTKLAQAGLVTLVINGWNEIPADKKLDCREWFNQLVAVAPTMSVLITTRTPHDAPDLADARHIAVRGLSWQGQADIIRAELRHGADALIELLGRNNRLRLAAKSPLILKGLVERARSGDTAQADSEMDLLGAVVSTFETDERRSLTLATTPVFRHQRRYLEQLASAMNIARSTNLSRQQAVVEIGLVADALRQEHQLSFSPQPADILEVLISHHLLHQQDETVRFVHQRFQEYFSATLLLQLATAQVESSTLLVEAMNEPIWFDALRLVAGKLSVAESPMAVRAHLVDLAARIDLALACEFAGLSGFNRGDDDSLHDRLVSDVQSMHESPLRRVKNLAVACQMSSRFPVFADSLLSTLSSENQQERLELHRLNRSGLSIKQLGVGSEARIKGWSVERRSEFLGEMAENPDNYDFIRQWANEDLDARVRASAITALLWHYPASGAGSTAWLNAPLEVQTDSSLINQLRYIVEEGLVPEVLIDRLRLIMAGDLSADVRLHLVLAFPALACPNAVEIVLERLASLERRLDPEPLLSIATTFAAVRLQALAIELAGTPGVPPDWVDDVLLAAPEEIKSQAFERAWQLVVDQPSRRPNGQIVGSLANREQTRRCVRAWLTFYQTPREARSTDDEDRHTSIRYLIAQAPGDQLLDAVMEFGADASYEEALVLVNLLWDRVSPFNGSSERENRWAPTIEQFQRLFDLMAPKPETAPVRQDGVFVYLACIASRVDASHFGPLLIEAFHRQLDAWGAFAAARDIWQKNPRSPRPLNPSYGGYLNVALATWGIGSLDGLLALSSHPSAIELLPEAIARVTVDARSRNRRNWSGHHLDAALSEGRTRRDAGEVFLQVPGEDQARTDAAARELGRLLSLEVERQQAERQSNPNWNARNSEYRIGRLAGLLSAIPSPEALTPVVLALSSGLMGLFKFGEALTNLVTQGWIPSAPGVAAELEILHQREASAAWLDESKRYALTQLCRLAFVIEPSSLLKEPLDHYLAAWRKTGYASDVVNGLAKVETPYAWDTLLQMAGELWEAKQLPSDIARTLTAALSPERFPRFAQLIADRSLFVWCSSAWELEQIAATVAAAVSPVPEHRQLLLDSWREARSPLADALVMKILQHLGVSESEKIVIGLEAWDAGRSRTDMPAYKLLKQLFSLRVPLGPNQEEIYAKSCNVLRTEMYRRAGDSGPTSNSARSLLASVELSRRSDERPLDEPRHPDLRDGTSWTQIFAPHS